MTTRAGWLQTLRRYCNACIREGEGGGKGGGEEGGGGGRGGEGRGGEEGVRGEGEVRKG